MRALLVALAAPDPASLRAALQSALGATSVDLCQAAEAAITWLENRPCDLVAVAGDEGVVPELVARLRRVSRALPVLALVPDTTSRAAGAAWIAGADEVASMAALVAGAPLEGLDEVRHPERDALRRLQRLWHAGSGDALRQALATRVTARFRDVGLTGEGLVGLTTQDVETPQAAALVVNATTDADTLVLGVRRVKRTYPDLAVVVVADAALHDAFRRAGADECLAAAADAEAVLDGVARAQATCRAALDLEALRARETRLRALLEHLPEAVMLVSPEHAVLAVNLAALRLIGAQDARQVLGSPLAPWLDLGEEHLDAAVQAGDGVGGGATREFFARTRHLADPKRLLLRAVPFQRESGGAPAALIALREATEPPSFEPDLVATPTPAASHAEAEARRAERAHWDAEREAWALERATLLDRLDQQASDEATVEALRLEMDRARAALGEARLSLQQHEQARARLAAFDGSGIEPGDVPTLVDAAARLAVLEHQEVPALLARAQTQQQAYEDQMARLREVAATLETISAERDAALDATRAADARVEALEAQLADLAQVAARDAEPDLRESAPATTVAVVQRWLLEDVARVAVVRTSPDGRIIHANDRAGQLCGLSDGTALVAARTLPAALTTLVARADATTVTFETCVQVAGAAPRWVAGARLAALDGADDVTWLLSEMDPPSPRAPGPDASALLEALADECLQIVETSPAPPRGPRPLHDDQPASNVGAAALGRVRVLLSQLATCRRRRHGVVAIDDLAAHLAALDPLLARLATDDITWTSTLPSEDVPVPVAPADLERCLTGAVAALREALPLGGHLALRVDTDDRVKDDGLGRAALRPTVEVCLDAEGYGVQTPDIPHALTDLIARLGGTLEVRTTQSRAVHLIIALPRVVVVARAA